MGNALRLGGIAATLVVVGATAPIDSAEGKNGDSLFLLPKSVSVRNSVTDNILPGTLPPPDMGAHGDIEILRQMASLSTSYAAGLVQGRDSCPEITLGLASEMAGVTAENVRLLGELNATRAQVEELVERLETTEQACVDATTGEPVGLVYEDAPKQQPKKPQTIEERCGPCHTN